jgi:hypothetical protein
MCYLQIISKEMADYCQSQAGTLLFSSGGLLVIITLAITPFVAYNDCCGSVAWLYCCKEAFHGYT